MASPADRHETYSKVLAFLLVIGIISAFAFAIATTYDPRDVTVHSGEGLVEGIDGDHNGIDVLLSPTSVGKVDYITVVKPSGNVMDRTYVSPGETRVGLSVGGVSSSDGTWTVYGFADDDGDDATGEATTLFRITFSISLNYPFV